MRTVLARAALAAALAVGALGCGGYDEASDTGTTADPESGQDAEGGY